MTLIHQVKYVCYCYCNTRSYGQPTIQFTHAARLSSKVNYVIKINGVLPSVTSMGIVNIIALVDNQIDTLFSYEEHISRLQSIGTFFCDINFAA